MRTSRLITDWIEKELRSNLARASRAGRRAAKMEPRAGRVAYLARERVLRIELTNGAAITLPVKLIPSLRRAAARDVRAVEILGRGGGLHWKRLDLDLSVPGLLSSVFAGPEWLGGARPHWWQPLLDGEGSRSAQKRAQGRSSARSITKRPSVHARGSGSAKLSGRN